MTSVHVEYRRDTETGGKQNVQEEWEVSELQCVNHWHWSGSGCVFVTESVWGST